MSVSLVAFAVSFRTLSATSAVTVEVSSMTDTPAPAATATMPAARPTAIFCEKLLPRCSALISAVPLNNALVFFSRALVVLVFLWRMMPSPEVIPTLPPPADAAKARLEEPCLAIASTVRFLAYTFFFALTLEEEISASVFRSKVSQLADTPMETPAAAAAAIAGVPVKEPIFV